MPKPVSKENIEKARKKIKELSLFTSVNCMPQISSLDLCEKLTEIEQLLIPEPIVARYAVGDWINISPNYYDKCSRFSICDFDLGKSYIVLKVRFNQGDQICTERNNPHFVYYVFGKNNLNKLTEEDILDFAPVPPRILVTENNAHLITE